MMNAQTSPYGYGSGHLRAVAAMLLLGASACAHLLWAILHAFMAGGVLGGPDAAAAGEETLSVAEALNAVVLLLNFFAYVAAVVAFLLWVHRAYSNLRPLGARQLNDTPGMAVGSFFIPILNLFRPYKAVREIWRWSKPVEDAGSEIAGLSFTADTGAPLVGWWWGLWITSSVVSNLYYRLIDEEHAAEALPWLGLMNDVMTIAAAAVAILMIRSIDRMQEERSKQFALGATPFEQPPPPPAFGTFGQQQS
jgi:hypothetical protein